MTRRPRSSDEALVELFLDMLAAERGAGANTLAAYRNDLEDLSAHMRASRTHDGRRDDRRSARIYCEPVRAWLQGIFACASPIRGPPALSVPLCGRTTQRRPGRSPGGAETWTTVAQSAFDRRCRSTSEERRRQTARTPSSRLRNACGPHACYACWKSFMPPACAYRNL